MLKEHRRFFRSLFVVSDLVLIGAAWMAAYAIRFRSGWIPLYDQVPAIDVYLVNIPLVLSVWAALFVHMGVYKFNRWLELSEAVYCVFRASLLSMIVLICTIYLSTKIEISRVFYACFFVLTLCLLLFSRLLLKALFGTLHTRGYNLRHVLMVGNNSMSGLYIERVKSHPELGISVRGCLADNNMIRKAFYEIRQCLILFGNKPLDFGVSFYLIFGDGVQFT